MNGPEGLTASMLHKVSRTPRYMDIELSRGPGLPHIQLHPLLRSKANGQSDLWEELKTVTQDACSLEQPLSTYRYGLSFLTWTSETASNEPQASTEVMPRGHQDDVSEM